MTLKIIEASGDPYNIGHMIGTAVRHQVQSVTVHSEELDYAVQRWRGSEYVAQLMAAARQIFGQYMRELEGMSDGMEVPFEDAFIWNCRGDLNWPDDISPAVAAGLTEGCTSLIIPATDASPATIAHNEDGGFDFYNACFWLKATPDTGPAFESFLYPGMIPGHTLGANAAGIVQTINNIRVFDLKVGLPRHFICRAILECRTMDAALGWLRRSDRAAGFHHNLGSARDGRLVSVEAPAGGCAVREITDGPAAHANHLIRAEMKDRSQDVTRSSSVRQQRADELLGAGRLDEAGPGGILFETKLGFEILRKPDDGGDDYGRTLASGIFELRPGGINVRIHDGPDRQNIYSTDIVF